MLVAISGTPGTGKSVVAKALAKKLNYTLLPINDLAEKKKLIVCYDKKRQTSIVDVKKLKKECLKLKDNTIIEGHLAHFCKADYVFVLRANPKVLEKRLKRKGWSKEKIKENVEAEILDVVLQEAVSENKRVFEVDTTKRKEKQVVQIILNILKGIKEERYKPGKIDWTSYLK